MQKKQQQELPDSQNIMATILASIPKEASVTKIDYEGPRIALYTKTPRFLMENNTIISNLVNQIKKRIVIRIVESIRMNEEEARKILNDKVPKEANLQGTFFDTASGEVSIEVKRPWLCLRNPEFNHAEISGKIGWKLRVRKSTTKPSSTIKEDIKKGMILILRVTPLAQRDVEKLRKVVEELYVIARDSGADIARLGEERIVVTPPRIKIWKPDYDLK